MTEEQKLKTKSFLKNRDQWIRAVISNPDFSSIDVRVGIHIAMRINSSEKSAWPSTKKIAEMTCVSVRSVISSTQKLEDEGYLHVARKRNVGNNYWLKFFWQ